MPALLCWMAKRLRNFRQPRNFHILAVDHSLLAQGDDLFADAQQVALLVEGLDVAVDEFDVILADLDKVRLDGVTQIDARGRLNFNVFGAVCNKIHEESLFRAVFESIKI